MGDRNQTRRPDYIRKRNVCIGVIVEQRTNNPRRYQGVIVDCVDRPWGCDIRVQIVTPNLFYPRGEIIEVQRRHVRRIRKITI